eukprot:UN30231
MSWGVFVGNLPSQTSTDELTNLFSEHGEIESVKVFSSESEMSHGFVNFSEVSSQHEAVKSKHGINYKGKNIQVRISKSSNNIKQQNNNKPNKMNQKINNDSRNNNQKSSSPKYNYNNRQNDWNRSRSWSLNSNQSFNNNQQHNNGKHNNHNNHNNHNHRDHSNNNGRDSNNNYNNHQGKNSQYNSRYNNKSNKKHYNRPQDTADIYVSGYPEHLSEEQLEQLLENTCKVPCLRLSCKGHYCFYRVATKDYQEAMRNFSNAQIEGRQLQCQPAKGGHNRSQNRRNSNWRQNQHSQLSQQLCQAASEYNISPFLDPVQMHSLERSLRTVYVGNIPNPGTEDDLRNSFSHMGPIESVILVTDALTKIHKGYGFVIFKQHESAVYALSQHELINLYNNKLSVQTSRPSDKYVIKLAIGYGLIDNQCRATNLFFNLLRKAKLNLSYNQQGQDNGGFQQNQSQCQVQQPQTPSHQQQQQPQQTHQYQTPSTPNQSNSATPTVQVQTLPLQQGFVNAQQVPQGSMYVVNPATQQMFLMRTNYLQQVQQFIQQGQGQQQQQVGGQPSPAYYQQAIQQPQPTSTPRCLSPGAYPQTRQPVQSATTQPTPVTSGGNLYYSQDTSQQYTGQTEGSFYAHAPQSPTIVSPVTSQHAQYFTQSNPNSVLNTQQICINQPAAYYYGASPMIVQQQPQTTTTTAPQTTAMQSAYTTTSIPQYP